ncbi:MAG: YncE family protein [Dehalococcoidia bacterium]|nr:YncE family protein [Dehalococcoidia bacterium]
MLRAHLAGRGTLVLAVAALLLFAAALAWPSAPAPAEGLLVTDLRGRALLLLDPAQPKAVRRIPLPGGPHELLRLPDGRVAVSLEQSGALALVDVDAGAVETLEVGGLPHGLALDGATLLVTDRSMDAVRRFDLETWRELGLRPVEPWPHAVAVLPSGEVAVASAQAGVLSMGDHHYETGALTESVAVASDGRVAVAAALDGRVEVRSADGALLARHEVGGRPVRVAFSPDGGRLAVALSARGAVALIEGGEVRVTSVAGVPDGLAFSSDGRVLFVSDVYGGAVSGVRSADGALIAVMPVGDGTGALLAWSGR